MASTPAGPTRTTAILERLRRRLAAMASGSHWPAKRDEAGTPLPAAEPAADVSRAVVFVTVFGLSDAALADVLDMILEERTGRPVSPVLITDSLDFKPFRERRLRFEYVPDGGTRQRFAPDLDWPTYELRRYRLLAEKWRPQSLISFGAPPPAACVAVIRSPTSTLVIAGRRSA